LIDQEYLCRGFSSPPEIGSHPLSLSTLSAFVLEEQRLPVSTAALGIGAHSPCCVGAPRHLALLAH